MASEGVGDKNYELQLPQDKESWGNGDLKLIIDSEGNWCDIPVASDTYTFADLVERYLKPRLPNEMDRLEKKRMFQAQDSDKKESIVGLGLFSYEAPQDEHHEKADWIDGLVKRLRDVRLPVKRVPTQLKPSLQIDSDYFIDQDHEPDGWMYVNVLREKTFVLCPALSTYDSDENTGDNDAVVGYKAAIGVDGEALFGLLKPEQIHRNEQRKGGNFVLTKDVLAAVKLLVEHNAIAV